MKKRKIRLLIAILSLFLMGNILHGQSKSKEALGNSLAESIAGNDMDRFKSLLLPKDVAIKYQENNDSEANDKEERDSLMAQYEAAYDNMVIPRYERNFAEMVQKNENSDIDWSDLNFMILYKDSSKGEEFIPFFMHTKLNSKNYKHFYFGTVRYHGAWYLSGTMEMTKDEKYAP
jgi:hypothetical protein